MIYIPVDGDAEKDGHHYDMDEAAQGDGDVDDEDDEKHDLDGASIHDDGDDDDDGLCRVEQW